MSALRMEEQLGRILDFSHKEALLRRKEQLLFRFFDQGSHQLKLNPASLAK